MLQTYDNRIRTMRSAIQTARPVAQGAGKNVVKKAFFFAISASAYLMRRKPLLTRRFLLQSRILFDYPVLLTFFEFC